MTIKFYDTSALLLKEKFNPKEIFILSHSILPYPKKRINIIAITVYIETSVANIATIT